VTDALIAPGSDEFNALFTGFKRSAYRLETLQSYGSPDEDAFYAAFLAGEPFPADDAGKQWWITNVVEPATAAGRGMSRVHIVREPLSDYMRFELTWAYAPNVNAGDSIGIIPVAEGSPWPAPFPEDYDYWLIDDRLYEMVYADDAIRTWLGVCPVAEMDWQRHRRAKVWRDIALDVAVPWRKYVASRPELAALLPGMPQGGR
jgi:hypothetical protein